MSKRRHTEAQIIAALKQVEAGRTADDVARERLVADLSLDREMLKAVIAKNGLSS